MTPSQAYTKHLDGIWFTANLTNKKSIHGLLFPFSFVGGSGSASAEDDLELFVPRCHYNWNTEITNLLHMPNVSDLSRYTHNIQTL